MTHEPILPMALPTHDAPAKEPTTHRCKLCRKTVQTAGESWIGYCDACWEEGERA